MAKLADAADLKSAGAKALWGFDSPSRHQIISRIYAGLAHQFGLASFGTEGSKISKGAVSGAVPVARCMRARSSISTAAR
jgi:hypothetical protein